MNTQLMMGTAQLTTQYGVAERRQSAPTAADALDLLSFAVSRHLTSFDTASAYGDSERILGEFAASYPIEITTKLKAPETVEEWRSGLNASLDRLRVRTIRGLLLHSLPQNGELEHAMRNVVRDEYGDRIVHYGVSVYAPDEALQAIDSGLYDLLQIPASILDQRFRRAGVFARAREANVALDVRSVFLQGLLTLEMTEIPSHLQPLAPLVAEVRALARSCARSLPELAVAYARDALGAAGIVIGMTSAAEVEQNLQWWNSGGLPAEIIDAIHALDPGEAETLLDPRRWKREN